MGDYRQLKVWQKSHSVAVDSRTLSAVIRGSENAGFRNQIVRCAFSIPANLVEGNGAQTPAEYSRFVRISINSANELQYHLTTVRDLGVVDFGKADDLLARIEEVRRMLYGLLGYLQSKSRT